MRFLWSKLTAINSNRFASFDPECTCGSETEAGGRGVVVEVLRTDIQSVQPHIDFPQQCNPGGADWQLGSLPVHACSALLSPHLQPQTAQFTCSVTEFKVGCAVRRGCDLIHSDQCFHQRCLGGNTRDCSDPVINLTKVENAECKY